MRLSSAERFPAGLAGAQVAPSGSGSRNGLGGRPPPPRPYAFAIGSLTALGPAKFMGLVDVRAMEDASAHRIWGACV
jgi:hypothetical protein